MSNTVTIRKPCTINDLAKVAGTIDSLTMGEIEGEMLHKLIDKAMAADKKADGYFGRAQAAALEAQVQWGVL